MDTLIVPDLATIRSWLEKLEIAYFECDSCQSLHLYYTQNIEGVIDAKVDLVDGVLIFAASAAIRPTGLIPLVADLSQINAAMMVAKVFIDIQDDSFPRLVIYQSISVDAGLALVQFHHFIAEFEDIVAQIIQDVKTNELLMTTRIDYEENEELEDEIFFTSIEPQLLH